MSEKRFYCDDFGEYRSYAIYDCSKVDKTKENFWDNVEEVYDIIAYEEYLQENDCMLISNEVVDLLNNLHQENQQLQERNAHNFAKKMQLQKEIKELKEEEKLYAKEIVRLNKNIEELNKTIEEALKFKSLGGDY